MTGKKGKANLERESARGINMAEKKPIYEMTMTVNIEYDAGLREFKRWMECVGDNELADHIVGYSFMGHELELAKRVKP